MTTLAQCWKLTRKDAAIYAFTNHDTDLTVSGTTYISAIGFVPSAMERSTELKTDNQTLSGIIDDVSITAEDLRNGKWDGARVEIIEADWQTLTAERTLLVGFLGDVEIVGNQYNATLNSLEFELQKPIGRTIQLRCDADLGDTRCGFVLTGDSGSVTTATSNIQFVDVALTAADGYYNGGKIEWLTGLNAGLTFDVRRYQSVSDTIDLYQPTPYAVQIGDTFTIYRGCDKTFETCRDTFANAVNFRGYPHLPGITDMVSGRTT